MRRQSSAAAPAAALSSPKPANGTSKKRRYIDLEARCRNPFCGVILPNKSQRYCDGNRLCQLHRGLFAHCAWPGDPDTSDTIKKKNSSSSSSSQKAKATAAKDERKQAPAPGVPSLSPPLPAPQSSRKSPTHATTNKSRLSTTTKASGGANVPSDSNSTTHTGDKRLHVSVEEETKESSRDAKRQRTQGTSNSTSSSGGVMTTPTAAQQIKAAQIGVVALGVGNRSIGAGGRYVQGTMRGSVFEPSNNTIRLSSYDKVPTAPTTPTVGAITEQPVSAPPTLPPPPPPQPTNLPPPPPPPPPPLHAQRTLFRTNSMPSSSTDPSRDPRRRISAADYLSNRNKETSTAPFEPDAHPPETLLTIRPPQGTSAASTTPGPTPKTGPQDPRRLRRAVSDSTAASITTQSTRSDHSYQPAHPPVRPSNPPCAADDSHHRSSEDDRRASTQSPHWRSSHPRRTDESSTSNSSRRDDSAHPNPSTGYRSQSDHAAGSHAVDRPQLTRASSYSSNTDSSTHAHASSAPSNRSPRPVEVPRAVRLQAAMLRANFSHADAFLRLVLTRMASFLPNALGAIRNKTTKPRKLRFYLDYADRVTEYCGDLVKVTVLEGVARVTVAGREWLAVKGSSTTDLYQEILEKLLGESEMWRDLILELQSFYRSQVRNYGSATVPGVSFLKVLSSIKRRELPQLKHAHIQSQYLVGVNSHHWSFILGNVEVGSGSAESKVNAFHDATTSAFALIHDAAILPDKEKYKVAEIDRRRDPRSNPRDDSRSNNASNRDRTSRDNPNRERRATTPFASSTSSALTATTTTARVGAIIDEPKATVAPRPRGNSWLDAGDLDAAFSPPARSESQHGDDDNESTSMSISDDDKDPQQQLKSAPPSAVPVQVPVEPPTCRFCQDMQAVKPGRKCLKHERQAATEAAAAATPSLSATQTMDILHSFLRQPTANVVSPNDSVTTQSSESSASLDRVKPHG